MYFGRRGAIAGQLHALWVGLGLSLSLYLSPCGKVFVDLSCDWLILAPNCQLTLPTLCVSMFVLPGLSDLLCERTSCFLRLL
jgi:hypothetical protein